MRENHSKRLWSQLYSKNSIQVETFAVEIHFLFWVNFGGNESLIIWVGGGHHCQAGSTILTTRASLLHEVGLGQSSPNKFIYPLFPYSRELVHVLNTVMPSVNKEEYAAMNSFPWDRWC